jgi:taurine--2-oxoglutarate transaminase
MDTTTAPGMTAEEIVRLSRKHTFFSWSIQGAVDPIAIDHAEGVYLYTPDGQRILDFNSQLMSVNIGHGDRRVIDAITEQALKLQYVQPAFATEPRARLGQKLAEILPGDMDKVFFTLGGAEAIENAIKIARHYTGRYKVLARYRAYHGATLGAMTLTGDPRRWANEPGLVGVVRYPDTHRWGEKEPRPVEESLRGLEDVIMYEGPHTIAAVFLETIVGTNGILIPPDGYIPGVREICDRHDILMVADEVMAGFGRTGRWFAIDHWDVTPDLMTMAKGLTSSYLPLGAVAMRRHIAEKFESMMFYGGLTYSSHPVSLAAALATIGVYEADGLLERTARLGPIMRRHHEALYERHPSVGAHRSLGLFGILDLVRSRDPYVPLTPFNGTSDEMKAVGRYLRENGLYTMIANNSTPPHPPRVITEAQLEEGFAIIDRALDIADRAVSG